MKTLAIKDPVGMASELPKTCKKCAWLGWGFIIIVALTTMALFQRYGALLDNYEIGLGVFCAVVIAWGGYQWIGLRRLLVLIAVSVWIADYFYQGNPEFAQQKFFLKYFLASQSAIMWMAFLSILATLCYWIGLFLPLPEQKEPQIKKNNFVLESAHGLVWCAVYFGFTGLMVRWLESYQLGADIGHIPVSNLYEVSILFCLVTMLMLLYYEGRTGLRNLGAFVMLVVLADTFFTLWYATARQAFTIQPLIPALQSWWMKIHVPANFVGYGAFSAAAMIAVPHLLIHKFPSLTSRLPEPKKIEEIMYRLIATGFVAFTIATILGALWAAEAWGAYWQWDPKETWALIVWLNYAAWLHIRHLHRVSSQWLSWWAIIGLLITAFAFYGVNMYLSGLHSYGSL